MSLDQLAALCIHMYQKYISPHKGFRCAHRALHGGASCSEFARQYTLEHGIWSMFPALRMRFRECRMAKETLVADAQAAQQRNDPTPLWCDVCGGVGEQGTECGWCAATNSCDAMTPSFCDIPGGDACDCSCG